MLTARVILTKLQHGDNTVVKLTKSPAVAKMTDRTASQ